VKQTTGGLINNIEPQENLEEKKSVISKPNGICQWKPLSHMQRATQCGCGNTINKYLDELYACKKPAQLHRLITNVCDL